jgi:transglutaminase-like putative cysteine protease
LKKKPLAILICIILLGGMTQVIQAAKKYKYVYRSSYTYENLSNDTFPFTESDTSLLLFQENRWQTANIREISHEILKIIDDEDGNPTALINLPSEIPPEQTLTFSVEYVITAEDMPRPSIDPVDAGNITAIPEKIKREYTPETETFRKNEEIESLAHRLAGNTTTILGIVVDVLGWITENISYCNFEVPLYPDETLGDSQGDCDDQAILMISMLRSLGIPAFLQVGVVFSDGISDETSSWGGHLTFKQEGVGWHAWVMAYVPPWGWLPVDLTLTAYSEPMEIILGAPQYDSSIITAFNVSKQPYISSSRASRKEIMESDVYITITDTLIIEPKVQNWVNFAYIGLGLLAGGSFIYYIMYIDRRKSQIMCTELSTESQIS